MTLASGLTVDDDNRAAWLAERKRCIGASECAAALGISPYPDDTPLNLYLRKRGELPEREETAAMRRGQRLEPVILEEYCERFGIDPAGLARQVFLRHPELPWMTATLDAVLPDGSIVEAKSVGWRQAHLWGEEVIADAENDQIPEAYLCQVHHQLAVSGAEVAHVAALIGGSDLRVYYVRRDDRLIASIIAGLERFMRCLEAGIPPAPRGPDVPLLAALYPRAEGRVELPEELVEVARVYRESGPVIAEMQAHRDDAKAALLGALGEAEEGVLPDGTVLRRSIVSVAERVQKVKAHSYVTLRVREPRRGRA